MGKNKRNNKNKKQPAAGAAGGGDAAAAKSDSNGTVPSNSNGNRAIPELSYRPRRQLNELVLKLLALVEVQPENPKEEWNQYVQIQDLLQRIIELEEPIRLASETGSSAGDRLAKVERFKEWAESRGVVNTAVEIATIPGYELGLKATRDIQAEEKVLSVPHHTIFSMESLPESERNLIDNFSALGNLKLVYALIIERARGDQSPWKPYLDVLPAQYNTVLYYTPDQMQRLQRTSVCSEAVRQCRLIARQYANMYTCAHVPAKATGTEVANKGAYFTAHGVCYEVYRWAVSTVMTRQNLVPRKFHVKDESGQENVLEEEPVSALIPFWDMANHGSGKITTFFDHSAGEVSCNAQQAYSAGEQFFIYYGDRSNAEFLVNNGFVDPDNHNDYVNIRLGLSPTDPLVEKRASILSALGIKRRVELRVLPAPVYIHGDLLAFVRVFNMSAEQLEHWTSNLERARDLQYIDCALETDHERSTWQYLYERLKLLLASFEASAKATNSEPESKDSDREIDQIIQQYRRQERSILAGALQYVQEHCKV
ncbi:actin-histidine N-methyltransferase [Drosophila bipectinata]|uniref:actin-histidine N-methyltransferase n=1 Tax=Drosophila bipectinata TaxID=42026 RepID=UPI001C89C389|nr:actin-histidine N-methyltransferase [Drosophila bipectinata]